MSARQFIKNMWYVMTEIDFDKLVNLASSPSTEKSLGSLDSIMKNMGNIEKIIKNLDSFITVLEKSPTISAAIRIAAKQNEVSLEPLRKDIQYVETGLKPASDLHLKMFEELNKLSSEDLEKLLKEQKAQHDSIQTKTGKTDDK